ncbi:MAG: PEGA domain-containing protein, partial [Deltaproteobacteria bacterium]|nr:PEGA domain-containing protein [Deltaproteobacteria bacterium]
MLTTVSIDGKEVGTTPFAAPLESAAGTHEVGMAHPSYHALYRKVTIRPGETTTLKVNL